MDRLSLSSDVPVQPNETCQPVSKLAIQVDEVKRRHMKRTPQTESNLPIIPAICFHQLPELDSSNEEMKHPE